jgi:hypothetical protein
MQTSTIDVGNGVCFGFSDSGAPSGSQDYTTVLTVHGLGWNAGMPKCALFLLGLTSFW